ncbi:response regulator [Azospirillum himalayense]|uniref:Response regulator n=1 Tax=Azospirillum himalayense TaxID=654847 RepID=A0ABW0GGD2_9PROT
MQVVIVDDDPSTLFITGAVIRRIDGAEPIGMGSPLDALDWLAVNTPDLILIDHVMPDLDGMERWNASAPSGIWPTFRW